MERHGIEWEHKGTHEKHLSVLDHKKQEREKEVVQLEGQILEKKEGFQILSDRVENYDKGIENLKTLEQVLDTSPEYQLSLIHISEPTRHVTLSRMPSSA